MKYKIFGFLAFVMFALFFYWVALSGSKELVFEHVCPDSQGYVPDFVYIDEHDEYVQKLRQEFHLDEIIQNETTDVEKVLKMMDWVHNLWEHTGDTIPEFSDPAFILHEVIEHKKQFRCVEYAIVLTACLQAIGLQARKLSLKTKDVETKEYGAGHVVVEVFIPYFNKWVMVDPQANVMSFYKNIPLHAVELQNVLAKKEYKDIDIVSIAGKHSDDYKQLYIDFVFQYLYYFDIPLYNLAFSKPVPKLMLVPLGAPCVRIFQKTQKIENVHYTHSIACFYPDVS